MVPAKLRDVVERVYSVTQRQGVNTRIAPRLHSNWISRAKPLFTLLAKASNKPIGVVLSRVRAEARIRWEEYVIPRRGSGIDLGHILTDVGAQRLEAAWEQLSSRPFPAVTNLAQAALDQISPGESTRLLALAAAAIRGDLELLGSGRLPLGNRFDWHRDYKSGQRWDPDFFGRISYGQPDAQSDVKFPWELSRLQWLIPAAQAYVLTGDEVYAERVRNVLDDWIGQNPYGRSVNWTCTMEVAIRILSWSFLFHSCSRSASWADAAFRERFLISLYEHGHFTANHLEYSDVNGNHYTADAAGLVFAGLFFGGSAKSLTWQRLGWRALLEELPKQVSADGVDFEASTAYHRLVLELFLLPAVYRKRVGLDVPEEYCRRLQSMARFAAAYSAPNGLAPLVGDADDGRALPFGTQPLNDHRYLVGCLTVAFGSDELRRLFSGSRAEVAWIFGPEAAAGLPDAEFPEFPPESLAFEKGGFYALRSPTSHVFIDCGPVGLEGRGGHGHNDCLSLTATLRGTPLVSDCGAFVYTSSYVERNRFRSTAYHNTPQVDGEELNRFISPTHLWNIHYDAVPEVRQWLPTSSVDLFVGAHSGYLRLSAPAKPVRTVILDKHLDALLISDVLEGEGRHDVQIPLHFDPAIRLVSSKPGFCELASGAESFALRWVGPGWSIQAEPARVSPSYGVIENGLKLIWRFRGTGCPRLTVYVRPLRVGGFAWGEVAELLGRVGMRPSDYGLMLTDQT